MNSNSVEVRFLKPDEFAAVPIELPGRLSENDRGAAHYSSYQVAIATRHNCPVAAAALAIAHAGYGRIWPPYLAVDAPSGTLDVLLREAERFFQAIRPRPPRQIRALIDSEDVAAARQFMASGFDLHTSIQHFFCGNCNFAHGYPRGSLSFRKADADDFPSFQEILRQTYTDSHDCPELMSELDEADVRVRWQQSAGVGQSGTWLIAEVGQNEAGCLVLDRGNERESESVCSELVYMGLFPHYRGLGLGHEMVRWAQWLACQTRKSRLTVSVDVGNAHVLACYTRNGFVRYAASILYVKSIA